MAVQAIAQRERKETQLTVNGIFCQNSGGARGAPAAPAVAGGQPIDTIRRDEVCLIGDDD